jgi:DNA-binding transcriptional ArsR family regulator
MEPTDAIFALAALAQSTRLDAFRLLVAREPDGLPAGDLARALAVPQNTLSAHLNVMARAGLVHGDRQGRTITYRADTARLQELMLFLIEDCCGGRPELCGQLAAQLAPSCKQKPKRAKADA